MRFPPKVSKLGGVQSPRHFQVTMALTPDIRAVGAGLTATFAGAATKIVIRVLDYKYPGFVDASVTDPIDTLVVGALAGFGAWITRRATP